MIEGLDEERSAPRAPVASDQSLVATGVDSPEFEPAFERGSRRARHCGHGSATKGAAPETCQGEKKTVHLASIHGLLSSSSGVEGDAGAVVAPEGSGAWDVSGVEGS